MLGLPSPPSTPQPALLPAESLKDLVASCSRGAKAEAPMEVVKAEVMEMLTPPPSDVGSPSHSSPLSLSGGSSNSSSDSEPDSPLCDHGKVWGSWGGWVCVCVLPPQAGRWIHCITPGMPRAKHGRCQHGAAPHPIWGWREGCGGILGRTGLLHPYLCHVLCAPKCAWCPIPRAGAHAVYPMPVPHHRTPCPCPGAHGSSARAGEAGAPTTLTQQPGHAGPLPHGPLRLRLPLPLLQPPGLPPPGLWCPGPYGEPRHGWPQQEHHG